MTGYLALENYSPFLNLMVGFVSFCGIWGFGALIVRRLFAEMPSPWKQVLAAILGIQVLSLSVQLLGMMKLATPSCLIMVWGTMTFVGLIYRYRTFAARKSKITFLKNPCYLLLVVFVVAVLINLIMAITSSTKIDEMYYHMLLPSRIVSEQALTFYRYPWQGAVLPQMLYQISLTPLHAMGFPHAGNIHSWGLSILLVWFGASLIFQKTQSIKWSQLLVTLFVIGMYPVVWYVTNGAHALGDLSVVSVVMALALLGELKEVLPYKKMAGLVSILALGAASTKISLLPLVAIALCFSQFQLLRWATTGKERWQIIFWGFWPWVIFYVPILIWTWFVSGSPLGPVLAGKLGNSVYDVKEIRTTLQATHDVNRDAFFGKRGNNDFGHPLLLWGMVVLSLLIPKILLSVPALLFLVQAILIAFVLPFDVRFFGGTQLALIILLGIYATAKWRRWAESSVIRITLVVLFFTPWLAMQAYYAKPFASYLVGITQEDQFYDQYVAFYRDYQAIDKLLPPDAVLFSTGIRLNSIYAPRKVVFNKLDVKNHPKLYLFAVNGIQPRTSQELPAGYAVGKLIYSNLDTITVTSRVPRKKAKHGKLFVYALEYSQ